MTPTPVLRATGLAALAAAVPLTPAAGVLMSPAAGLARADLAATELDCLIEPQSIRELGSAVAGVLAAVEVDRGGSVRAGRVGVRLELPNPGNALPAGLTCMMRLLTE